MDPTQSVEVHTVPEMTKEEHWREVAGQIAANAMANYTLPPSHKLSDDWKNITKVVYTYLSTGQ